MSRSLAINVFLSFVVISLLLASSSATLKIIKHHTKKSGSLNLLAVGDWGRNGTYNQSAVAYQMGRIGEQLDIDFVISVGDNFYEKGLTGISDPQFNASFTNVYTAKGLQQQWYSVLGNHDYRGNALAQLDLVLQKLDKRWFCMRSFIVNTDVAQFFFVDTTPFVKKYWDHPKKNHYDWRGVAPANKYISTLLNDLDSELKKSTARWKIVIGHHGIRSVSDHGDTTELVNLLLPILENRGVDLYLNGHDHCLEHISSNKGPLQFITSGAGSKAWRGVYKPTKEKLRFFYDGQGFISLQLTDTKVDLLFFDINGNVLHQWNESKSLKQSM